MSKVNNWIFKILIIVVVFPIIVIAFQSLILRYSYDTLLPEAIDISAYAKLFSYEYLKLLAISILISVIASIATIILSIPLSSSLAHINCKYESIIYVALISPILIPQFVYFYGLQNVFYKLNILNTYLGVILSHMIVMMPYAILNISSDMKLYGKKYSEVAKIMQANEFNFYVDIIFPIIKGTLINTFGLLFIISFSQYFLTQMIGGGVIKTYATYLFPLILGNDRNYASKTALVYILINITIYMLLVKEKREYKSEQS